MLNTLSYHNPFCAQYVQHPNKCATFEHAECAIYTTPVLIAREASFPNSVIANNNRNIWVQTDAHASKARSVAFMAKKFKVDQHWRGGSPEHNSVYSPASGCEESCIMYNDSSIYAHLTNSNLNAHKPVSTVLEAPQAISAQRLQLMSTSLELAPQVLTPATRQKHKTAANTGPWPSDPRNYLMS